MSHTTPSKITEIDRNLEFFVQVLPALMSEHAGQYVLLRHGEIVDFHNSAIDAQIAGNRKIDDQMFSIQRIDEASEQLGYYSYAIDTGTS